MARRALFKTVCAVSAGFAAFSIASFASPASAQSPAAAETDPSDASAFEPGKATPPMWVVTDADSTIYLLGTFHILPPGIDWQRAYVDRAIDAADTVWFEAEVDTAEARQKAAQIVMTEGFNKGGGKLTDMLSPDDADLLRKIVGGAGLPIEAVDVMRPWYAFLTISLQFIVSKGFDADEGVETGLLQKARNLHKSLRFFETVDYQLHLFTSLPPEAQQNLLVFTLRDWDSETAQFAKLFDAWRTGDADAIDAMMNDSMRDEAPEAFDTLVADRNKAWTDEIASEMAGAGVEFIAVGSGHLVGKGSVPALLAAKGFKVERYGPDDAAQ